MTEVDLAPEVLSDLLGITLTTEQLQAATAPLEPGVIVAGAGSGKTTVMAARVVWLVATGLVRPDQVLGLTFTRKAATQLQARVQAALRAAGSTSWSDLSRAAGRPGSDDPGEATVSTYHAFAARILAEHGLRLGFEPAAEVLGEAARHQLAYQVTCATSSPLRALAMPPTRVVPALLALDDALAEHAVPPEDLERHDGKLMESLRAAGALSRIGTDMLQTAARRSELAGLVREFRQAKRERDVVDFADQVRLAMTLAEQVPEVGQVLREQAGVVLLDEYQDTSTAQRRMLQALLGPGHPVTAVGDPCQAIYGWRGASVHNIDAFPEHFPRGGGAGGAARYALSQNRRSGPAILALANELATPLREEHAGVAPLVPGARDKGPGGIRCALHLTRAEETAWVADRIAEIGAVRGRWEGIAVLLRVSSDMAAVAEALAARDVPVQVADVGGLLARPEIAEVRAVLEVLHDPAANPAVLRLLTGPRWRLGPRDLAALGARAARLAAAARPGAPDQRLTLAQALDRAVDGQDPAELVALADAIDDPGPPGPGSVSPEARERLVELSALLRSLRRHVGEPLGDLVHRVATDTGLAVELAASPRSRAARRPDALAAFGALAGEFRDGEGGSSLGAFLAMLRTAERYDVAPDLDLGGARDAVTLLTVHKAKGLEFDVVAVPFLSRTVFPSGRAQGRWPTSPTTVPLALRDEPASPPLRAFPPEGAPRARDHDAFIREARRLERLEETRLAYVAVTRAERLLLASGHWWGPSQTRPRGPGEFLERIHEFCRSGGGLVDVWAAPPAEGAGNPCLAASAALAWPAQPDPAASARLAAVAAEVAEAAAAAAAAAGSSSATAGPAPADEGMSPADQSLVAAWDRDLAVLVAEAQASHERSDRQVRLPASLSAADVLALAADPQAFARRLARPMPRRPAAMARRGTRFHAWVESRFGQQSLLGPDDLPGAADDDRGWDQDLEPLQQAFLASDYAQRQPLALEWPFTLVLAGRVVRGRIDAVFDGARPAGEVVDWKTGARAGLDPLQLAIYRLAWAEHVGVAPDEVDAAFLLVRTGEVIRPVDLPGRAELERLLADG